MKPLLCARCGGTFTMIDRVVLVKGDVSVGEFFPPIPLRGPMHNDCASAYVEERDRPFAIVEQGLERSGNYYPHYPARFERAA